MKKVILEDGKDFRPLNLDRNSFEFLCEQKVESKECLLPIDIDQTRYNVHIKFVHLIH